MSNIIKLPGMGAQPMGVQPGAPMAGMPAQGPAMQAPMEKRMTRDRIIKAQSILQEYHKGKQNLERRIKENDKWWKMRHWDVMENGAPNASPQRSAWLFNSLMNKHADAMDNFPEPNVLARASDDEATAQTLSEVLPVVMEQNDFESMYSSHWWDKLKNGPAVAGVFWNTNKLNGLGDVDIRNVEILNLFWQPDISDIQNSENVFHVERRRNEAVKREYEELARENMGESFQLTEYEKEDQPDTANTCLVVDWYYKVKNGTKTVLHYCKFVNHTVLYASEDDPEAQDGFYIDGKYPFVFDVLFPMKGSPAGFGYIDIMKDTQERIDGVGASIAQNAKMRAKKRYFIKGAGTVNEQEFLDWKKDLVHVEGGSVDDTNIRAIEVEPIGSDVINVYSIWIDELKETSGNRDWSQGGTTTGVTAASAIAALQEAGSKLSRDMIKSSYNAYRQICYMVLERIRQFYDLPRMFRITGQDGKARYEKLDNSGMMQEQSGDMGVESARLPIFDIEVKPQKASPYSKAAQNELAEQFYRLGFFSPANADQSLIALEMMQFDGKEKLIQKISMNGTLFKQVQALIQLGMGIAQDLSAAAPKMAAGILMQLKTIIGQSQGGGIPPVGDAGNGEPLKVNSLGGVQNADDIAGRVKQKTAEQANPGGGV